MDNAIVITAIQRDGFVLKEYSTFCIESWKNWCTKKNIPLFIIEDDSFIHLHKKNYICSFNENC